MIILSKIFGNSSFNSTINSIRLKNSQSKLFNSNLLKSELFTNSKLYVIFLASAVIATALLTNNAWAYKDGDFPGVGSYAKWQEAWEVENMVLKTEKVSEQIDLCKKAISIYPAEADFWINLGNRYNDKNKKIECYLQAARLNPDDCSGYQGAAYEYEHMGQYEKGIEYWEKAIAIKSNDSSFYAGLGNCYQKLKKYDEAVNCYKNGYRATNDINLLLNEGVLYLNCGNYQMAKECFENCQKLQPNNQNVKKAFNMLKSFKEKNN